MKDNSPSRHTSYDDRMWPATSNWCVDGDLQVGGVSMVALAARYGTPTYVVDELDVRMRCREYVNAFGEGNVAYTAKALLSRAIARWTAEEGLGLYVGSAGELHVALAGGHPVDGITLYGNAKTPQDLEAACRAGVGTIVVESLGEIPRVAAGAPRGQRVLLRVLTGLEVADGVDRRFGIRIDTGEAMAAVERLLAQRHLRLVGVDCSVGHQITRPVTYERELLVVYNFYDAVRGRFGAHLSEVNIGGGYAVAYSGDDNPATTAELAERIRRSVDGDSPSATRPRLTVSPGRAVVARAGITVYHVVSVSRDRHDRRLIAVDGGMSDCPATALCGGQHSAKLIGRVSRAEPASSVVVGRHNDSDDVIIPATHLPADTRPGDLLAVAGTGAYHHSRASNYQLVGRPPLVSVRNAIARVLVRRETDADFDLRDLDDSANRVTPVQ